MVSSSHGKQIRRTNAARAALSPAIARTAVLRPAYTAYTECMPFLRNKIKYGNYTREATAPRVFLFSANSKEDTIK